MSEGLGFVLAVAGVWLAIGLVLSIVMGRRGHNGFGWLVMGTLLGPLGIVLAVDASRHEESLQAKPLAGAASPGGGIGPVDVLVGYDGSAESSAAVDAVIGLLGERLGRLTVATVVPFGDIKQQERVASGELRQLRPRPTGPAPALEVLHGHPSAALSQYAIEGGYELIAVGTRGAGITKAFLGSAASELARDSKIPVLLVGGQSPR